MHVSANNATYYEQSVDLHWEDFTAFEMKSHILFAVQGEGDNILTGLTPSAVKKITNFYEIIVFNHVHPRWMNIEWLDWLDS